MLRPEPTPDEPSIEIRIAGRWNSRAMREAAMPTTPRCQPSLHSTTIGGGWPRSITRRRASSTTVCSSAWRSRLRSSSSAASAAARSGSRVRSSSSASSGRRSLPAALSRGPSRKPTSVARNGGTTPATRISARSPSDRVCRSAFKPSEAMVRFSPIKGATSAMVPRQAMRSRASSAAGRSQRMATACASLSASPAPVRSRNGYRQAGWCGLICTVSAGTWCDDR